MKTAVLTLVFIFGSPSLSLAAATPKNASPVNEKGLSKAKSNHSPRISQAELDKMAAQFYAAETRTGSLGEFGTGRGNQIGKQWLSKMEARPLRSMDFERCDEDEDGQHGGQTCRDAVCARIGSIYCNELSELEAVGRVCRGHYNGACVENVCDRIGSIYCNELSEMEGVMAVCRGTRGTSCLDKVCSMIGSIYCNELSEVRAVGEVCRGVRTSCIESVCQRVGTIYCNELSEIEAVARSCRGN